MILPNRIFFTGVPGSRWSGIAQIIEALPGFNTTDRTPEREYTHHNYSGHKGAYFGKSMEFNAALNADYIDQAWTNPSAGTQLVKSHEWAFHIPRIRRWFFDDWIMLVYRKDAPSFDWWKQAGGFNISYPSYASYRNDSGMRYEIHRQNRAMLRHAPNKWERFDANWIEKTFNLTTKHKDFTIYNDIQVQMVKP